MKKKTIIDNTNNKKYFMKYLAINGINSLIGFELAGQFIPLLSNVIGLKFLDQISLAYIGVLLLDFLGHLHQIFRWDRFISVSQELHDEFCHVPSCQGNVFDATTYNVAIALQNH